MPESKKEKDRFKEDYKKYIEECKIRKVVPTKLTYEEMYPLTGNYDNSSIEFLKLFNFKKKQKEVKE